MIGTPDVVTIAHTRGDQKRRAFLTVTEGLVIVPPHPDGPYGWSVTHERTGAALMQFDDPESAQAAAAALAPLAPWTESGDTVRRLDIADDVKSIRDRLGGRRLNSPPPDAAVMSR